jgi:hypothetical protein
MNTAGSNRKPEILDGDRQTENTGIFAPRWRNAVPKDIYHIFICASKAIIKPMSESEVWWVQN